MRIAETPEDFVVDELPLYPPSGEGEHCFVQLRKVGWTTEAAVRALARCVGVRPRDVGIAGRKDRVAVTTQWLSLPGIDPDRVRGLAGDGWEVLDARRHPHKLRTGQLAGNRFELVVRDVAPERVDGAADRFAAFGVRGVSNRFGRQRFGRDGDNAEKGRALLAGAALGRDRRAARFWLSALQAEAFNAFVAARPLPIDAIEPGEVAFRHDSGASFVVEAETLEQERERVARFEISASGPIPGTRLLQPSGEALARERAACVAAGIPDPLEPPRGIRMRGARRPVRVRPADGACDVIDPRTVRLAFTLPAGSFATVLAEDLLG